MRRFIIFVGLLWLWTLAMLLTLTWFMAHLAGGEVTIVIDTYNERYVEFGLWFVVWPIMTLALWYALAE